MRSLQFSDLTRDERLRIAAALSGHGEFNLDPKHEYGRHATDGAENRAVVNRRREQEAYYTLARKMEKEEPFPLTARDRKRIGMAALHRLQWEEPGEDLVLVEKLEAHGVRLPH